jgi:hypothetical protein
MIPVKAIMNEKDHPLSGKVSRAEGKKCVSCDKKEGLLSACRVQCVKETNPLHGKY